MLAKGQSQRTIQQTNNLAREPEDRLPTINLANVQEDRNEDQVCEWIGRQVAMNQASGDNEKEPRRIFEALWFGRNAKHGWVSWGDNYCQPGLLVLMAALVLISCAGIGKRRLRSVRVLITPPSSVPPMAFMASR